MLLGLVTAAVALVIDQASKYWILHDVLEDKAMIILRLSFRWCAPGIRGSAFQCLMTGG